MKNEFTIFAVCVIVVQKSVAILSESASGIQSDAMLDFSILQAYRTIAFYQSEKGAQNILARELQGCLAKSGLQDEEPAEGSLQTSETCESEIFIPWVASFDATLATILVLNPKASSAVATTQAIGISLYTALANAICSTIELALQGKNSSEARIQIQQIADQRAVGAATYNKLIFDAIRNGPNLNSKIDIAIDRAESKASRRLLAAIYDLFTGIAILIPCGTGADINNISSAIGIMINRVLSGIKAELNVKFELLLALLTASYIVELEFPANFSSIQAMMAMDFHDYGKEAYAHMTTGRNDTPKVVIGDKNVTVAGECEVENARATAIFQTQKAVSTIFDTIQTKLAQLQLRIANEAADQSRAFETAKNETVAAHIAGLDAVIDAILEINIEATSVVQIEQHAAESAVTKIDNIIFDAIRSIQSRNSSNILTNIQIMENFAVRRWKSIIKDIYDALQSDLNINPEFETAIEYAMNESISQVIRSCRRIFTAIRFYIAASSGSQDEIEGNILSINIVQTESSFAMRAAIQTIFDTIESLLQVQVETTANLSAIQRHRDTAIYQVVHAIDIIFNYIMDRMNALSSSNQTVPEYELDNIESERALTAASYEAALYAVFCTFPPSDSEAIPNLERTAVSEVLEGVEGYYMGISLTQGNNYSRIDSELQSIENATTYYLAKLVSDIYAMIRKIGKCDSETEAMIDRAEEETYYNDSKFYHLLAKDKVANNTLMLRQVTVFVPTNRAFQKYSGSTEGLVLYHMCNFAQTTDEFEFRNSMTTELPGGPPVWVTRKSGGYRPELYINNAKVLTERSNFQSTISGGPGERQVLHIIDEVLEPVRSNPTALPIYNPDAFQFLNQSENLSLGSHRVRSFRQRVSLMHKEDIFKADGRYTFFIPVDEGFKPQTRSGKIDQKVIDGHVIKDHVLFTAPTPKDRPYKTLTFTDNIKVTVSFITEQDGKDTRTYVKSNTLAGDSQHATGVVLAEIVKGNIPVRNGVVHLIQRPLMVVDTTVTQFLEDKEDGPVYKFYEAIMDVDKEFMLDLNRQRELTLFAPSNAAWEEPSLKPIRQDKKRMMEILKLHFVKERLPLEKIIQTNKNLQVATAADRKSLYFNIVQGPNGNETVTVEGGGVNATVTTSNIAATNGIVHIINRVLGVPYTTVQEKLMTDPMLKSTYFLGQRQGFNNQLNDTKKRFTYFVPRDYAWKAAEMKYPSTYKKLFMPEFAYHTESILERHVVVADQAYTMAKLKEEMHTNDTVILPALRGTLKLRVKESGENNYDEAEEYDENAIRPDQSPGYVIEWQNEWIRVFRPDVECTNGIIHVIDAVLLKDSDVRVTGGGASSITFAPHVVMILIAKWLL